MIWNFMIVLSCAGGCCNIAIVVYFHPFQIYMLMEDGWISLGHQYGPRLLPGSSVWSMTCSTTSIVVRSYNMMLVSGRRWDLTKGPYID